MIKEKKTIEKEFFLNNLSLLFSAREKALNNFKSRLSPKKNLYKIITREPTHEPTPELATELNKHKKFTSKFQQEFMNEEYTYFQYFRYQNPSFLAKDSVRATQAKNEHLVYNFNDGFVDLKMLVLKKSWK